MPCGRKKLPNSEQVWVNVAGRNVLVWSTCPRNREDEVKCARMIFEEDRTVVGKRNKDIVVTRTRQKDLAEFACEKHIEVSAASRTNPSVSPVPIKKGVLPSPSVLAPTPRPPILSRISTNSVAQVPAGPAKLVTGETRQSLASKSPPNASHPSLPQPTNPVERVASPTKPVVVASPFGFTAFREIKEREDRILKENESLKNEIAILKRKRELETPESGLQVDNKRLKLQIETMSKEMEAKRSADEFENKLREEQIQNSRVEILGTRHQHDPLSNEKLSRRSAGEYEEGIHKLRGENGIIENRPSESTGVGEGRDPSVKARLVGAENAEPKEQSFVSEMKKAKARDLLKQGAATEGATLTLEESLFLPLGEKTQQHLDDLAQLVKVMQDNQDIRASELELLREVDKLKRELASRAVVSTAESEMIDQIEILKRELECKPTKAELLEEVKILRQRLGSAEIKMVTQIATIKQQFQATESGLLKQVETTNSTEARLRKGIEALHTQVETMKKRLVSQPTEPRNIDKTLHELDFQDHPKLLKEIKDLKAQLSAKPTRSELLQENDGLKEQFSKANSEWSKTNAELQKEVEKLDRNLHDTQSHLRKKIEQLKQQMPDKPLQPDPVASELSNMRAAITAHNQESAGPQSTQDNVLLRELVENLYEEKMVLKGSVSNLQRRMDVIKDTVMGSEKTKIGESAELLEKAQDTLLDKLGMKKR